MLVRVPVDTSHAVFLGVAMRALYVASKASMSVTDGSTGWGRSVTPSKPDSPAQVS